MVMSIKNYTQSSIKYGMERLKMVVVRYFVWLLFGVSFIGLSVLGYTWYSRYKLEQSYGVLTQSVEALTSAMKHDDKNEWSLLINDLKKNVDHFRHHLVGPYFVKLYVKALVVSGDREQARLLLAQELPHVSVHHILYYLMKTEYALMCLDADDQVVKQEGVALLDAIAHDKKNSYPEYALFYLGRYYWVINDVQQARAVWSELLQTQYDSLVPSVWAAQAEQLLHQLP